MTRRAVVTGGSRGIGYSTAGQLLDAGFEVVITGRNEDSLLEAEETLSSRGPVTTLAFDASSAEATARALSPLQTDVLIANVGVGFSGSILKTSLDDWDMVLRNNLTSAFVAIQSVLGGMMERRWGRIVTVGSMASHIPIRSGVAYVASKHALLGVTRAIALDAKGSGVTVNMVAPAFVRTDMTKENVTRIVAASGLKSEVAEQKLAALSTLNRLLEPDEVAAQIMRFVLDEKGEVTGASIAMGFEPAVDEDSL
jgi:NAD(P)-dependent dehydrogenase (short-subunit alcohol dehydrogenase family)